MELLDRLNLSSYSVNLFIDAEFNPILGNWFIDVETDEHDNFVGMAMTTNGKEIYYYTKLLNLNKLNYIGHSIKNDVKWLIKWGINIKPEQIYMDTMIMSYVYNPTRLKHGLKNLAKEILNMDYPTYREMVGKGPKRQTLNKQSVERVANYCGLDVLATYRLYNYFNSKLTTQQRSLLNNVEMPLNRLLFKMEQIGIKVDLKYLRQLQEKFQLGLDELLNKLDKNVNFNSPKQVQQWLKSLGYNVKSTDKKVLVTLDHPKVKDLLEYRELQKLQSTYVIPLQKSEIVHTTYNQIINTGRLSSYEPNLQNIPTRTEKGDLLRKCFLPRRNNIFIDADYSQIEYRLLAHYSKEPILLEAFKKGVDVHEETARLLGVSRYVGKTLNFAAIYGAQPKKIAQTVNQSGEEKITDQTATKFLEEYWKKLPRVKYWIEKTKEEARSKKAFRCISGQWFNLYGIDSNDKYIRWHAERQAVNGIIQGSAAYTIKLAMLELEKQEYIPLLQVHDELLFEVENNTCLPIQQIKMIMENVIKLEVPLIVDLGIGSNWSEAKQ